MPWRRGALWGFGGSLVAVVVGQTAWLWTSPPVTGYVVARSLVAAALLTVLGLACLVMMLESGR